MLNIFIVLGVISNLFFDFYVSEKLLNITVNRFKLLLAIAINSTVIMFSNEIVSIIIEAILLYYLLKPKNVKFNYAIFGTIVSAMMTSYVITFVFDFFDLKLATQYRNYVLLFLPLEIILFFIGY